MMQKSLKKLLQRIPFFYDIFLQRKIEKKHRHVVDLLNGKTTHQISNQKSVLHFSINKSATQHVKKVLQKIAKEKMLIPVDYNGYAFATNLPYLDLLSHNDMEQYKHIFRPRGYLYSVLGGMVKNIDKMDEYRIVLTVRDPRDILVSKYFSIAYSHAIPENTGNKREGFLKKRVATKSMSIDEFVLKEYPRVLIRFEAYESELIQKYDHVTVLRYEDMITDYPGWLKKIEQACGVQISSSLFNSLAIDFENRKLKSENKFHHIRKGVSGDYREKLRPDTIQKLEKIFRPYTTSFGYMNDD